MRDAALHVISLLHLVLWLCVVGHDEITARANRVITVYGWGRYAMVQGTSPEGHHLDPVIGPTDAEGTPQTHNSSSHGLIIYDTRLDSVPANIADR